MKHLTRIALAATTALTLALPAKAADCMLFTWLEPNCIITRHAHAEWAEAVKKATNREVTQELLVGGALIPAQSTMQGTADGVAQVGFHTATCTPSDLPVSNALADMGFTYPDAMVMSFAFGDYMMNRPAGYNDRRKNGALFGGSYSTPICHFNCASKSPAWTISRASVSACQAAAGRGSGSIWASPRSTCPRTRSIPALNAGRLTAPVPTRRT